VTPDYADQNSTRQVAASGLDSGPNGPQKWLFDTADDESNAWELSFLKNAGYHAMGRNTYRVMAGHWPVSKESFSALMNSIPKLIFTHKGLDVDDAAITPRAVEEAKGEDGKDRSSRVC
jgi:dihydrofolate reductase